MICQLPRGHFGYIVRVVASSQVHHVRCKILSPSQKCVSVVVPVLRHYTALSTRSPTPSLLLGSPSISTPVRGVGLLVARVLRSALKLRYLLLGGTIAGGSALAK
ncbi:hypothetical protein FHG87_021613, partial [Trinorchestia longiramus]